MDEKNSQVIPLLPLRGVIVYPNMVIHLDVGRDKSIKALEKAMVDNSMILLCTQTDVNVETPNEEDMYGLGTVAKIRQMLKLPNGTIRVLVEGMYRAKVLGYLENDEYTEVSAEQLDDKVDNESELDALVRGVLDQFEQYVNLSRKVSSETYASVADIDEPGRLADVVCSHLSIKMKDKQEILETIDVNKRLERLLDLLSSECEVLRLEKKISQRVKKQMEKTQKEYYLREQLRAIQKELGEKEGRSGEVQELREQLEEIDLPETVKEKIEKEINRLEKTPNASAESGVIRNYIEWMLSLPWLNNTEDDLDMEKAEQILDEDHYGLEKPKERVLEYLAVQKLVQKLKGPILCFVGPPGVGKTSLGRSIAKSLGREFVRISLGGVRDEAEIRGHRRTYVGALPGRIIQGMKSAGSNNPVFLLDEIDKMAMDFRGDPASALLEVLDPEQNTTFSDHFIEHPFDLSNVMFITTANAVHNIPRPLLDRMEVLYISGYTELEKQQIGQRYLFPKQKEKHGLSEEQLHMNDDTLLKLIREYTREAGVRNLEQQLASVSRKSAKEIVSDSKIKEIVVDETKLVEYLGSSKYRYGLAEKENQIGSVTGLAWTEVGGDTLNIEIAILPGTGKLTLTGQLGDVMKESAQAAFSYTRAKVDDLGLDKDFQEKHDIHIHIPEGAIPKDGPSAGITIATALVSALTERAVSKEVAMTGEITLRGRVLPIGGLKEKTLAAHRAGIKTVLFPKQNEKDLEDIPDSVKQSLTFVPVDHMDEVLQHALVQ
ncbi:endopeptidase La [Longirhabdus pacifica]|uniref:endopeptidase La n=1 Tax=Longirhabdus pacifica TaxID=2305227 RepID=UPI001F0C3E9B|nr:endopeptidase La [Longirhabdus pacifica]